jgi:ketosteroid isomerase-like protein
MRAERVRGTLAAMSSTVTDHLTTITDLYAAFGRGDLPAILDVLAEDVRWEHWDDNTAQREGVSHLQPRTGRDGAAEFFATIGEIAFHGFEVRGLAAGDDLVVADVHIDATLPSGGRLRDEELHLWRFDADGRVCAMRHYVDTAKHIAAERGEDTTARAHEA